MNLTADVQKRDTGNRPKEIWLPRCLEPSTQFNFDVYGVVEFEEIFVNYESDFGRETKERKLVKGS